jgi:hypothetical protein
MHVDGISGVLVCVGMATRAGVGLLQVFRSTEAVTGVGSVSKHYWTLVAAIPAVPRGASARVTSDRTAIVVSSRALALQLQTFVVRTVATGEFEAGYVGAWVSSRCVL